MFALALLVGVWCVAIFGIVLKLGWPANSTAYRSGFLSRSAGAARCFPAAGFGTAEGWRCGSCSRAVRSIVSASSFRAWQRLRFQNVISALFRPWGRPAIHRGAGPGSDLSNSRGGDRDAGDRQVRGCHRRRQRHRQGAVRGFHGAGAAKVIVADIDGAGARATAAAVDRRGVPVRRRKEKDILHVIDETERQFGPIALFCSNAGIGGGFDPLSVNAGGTSDEPLREAGRSM